MQWAAVNICRAAIAATFVFSGIVKAADPLGSQYKIEEYVRAFGWSDVVPGFLPLWTAVLLAVFEFCMGIYMLFGIRRRLTCGLLLVFLGAATPFSLYLAVFNPVSDCGCFGEAVKLTNWQTFAKNVALLLMTLYVSRRRNRMTRLVSERNQWAVSLYSIFFAFVLAEVSLWHLPVFDFRPYHVGADVRALVEDADNQAEYRTTFVMEKDGKEKEFAMDDYPSDTTWKLVRRNTVLVGGSEKEPVDFTLCVWPDGDDVTQEALDVEGYAFWLVAPYLEEADDSDIDRINVLYDFASEHNYAFYCLTSSGDKSIEHWQEMTGAEYPFLTADDVTLKTVIRSNPGVVLLKDGVVYNKWSCHNLPKEEDLTEPLERSELGRLQTASRTATILRVVLWFALPLLIFSLSDRLWMRKKMKQKARIKHIIQTH